LLACSLRVRLTPIYDSRKVERPKKEDGNRGMVRGTYGKSMIKIAARAAMTTVTTPCIKLIVALELVTPSSAWMAHWLLTKSIASQQYPAIVEGFR